MQNETEILKYLIATLFMCNYQVGKGALPIIRLIDKRGFHACELVQYKVRSAEKAGKKDNLLLVLELFSHQRALDLSKTLLVELGSFEHHLKLRVVRTTKSKSGDGYSYVVQLQGNSNKPIFLERN
jgi:acetolactate synthase regulatory subunit